MRREEVSPSSLPLFVDCLKFTIEHAELTADIPFCVMEKDELRVNIFENMEFAEKDYSQFRLVTDNSSFATYPCKLNKK